MLNYRRDAVLPVQLECPSLFNHCEPALRWFELTKIVARWHFRSQQRRELARLSEHMLKDIGLSREQQWAEVRKPFWRA